MTPTFLKEKGVLPGPTGSLVRENDGINNTNHDELFSDRGIAALERALIAYKKAGATIGSAPTYGLTDLRANGNDADWKLDKSGLYLKGITATRNKAAVALAKKVWGGDVVGLIGSITDSSGGQDERWKDLDGKKVDWVAQRQRPQMEVLRREGVTVFMAEALRYVEEAEAIVRIARELSARAVVISFEVNERGLPDPQSASGYTFKELKADLKREAGSDTEVGVGGNCAAIPIITSVLDSVDAAYANRLNITDEAAKRRYTYLAERGDKRTEEENKEKKALEAEYGSTTEDFIAFFRDAYQRGVLLVGGCCGTKPQHTTLARQSLDQF